MFVGDLSYLARHPAGMALTTWCRQEFMSTSRWNAIVVVGHSESGKNFSEAGKSTGFEHWKVTPQDKRKARFQSRCLEARFQLYVSRPR